MIHHDAGRAGALRILVLPLLGLLAASPGCGGRRTRTPRPPIAEGTTIGRDLRATPAGSVLPATSLGVDLVDGSPPSISRSEPHAPRDLEIAPVSLSLDGSKQESEN